MPSAMTIPEAIALAHRWAALGVPAFPLGISWDDKKHATNKRPLTGEGGFKNANTDPETLRRMFNGCTSRSAEVIGVGLWLGPRHWMAADVDIKGDRRGGEQLAALEAEHGALPPAPKVHTASGGWHIILGKGDRHVDNHNLAPDIDIRSDDGYIVAAGTRTPWGSWKLDRVTGVPLLEGVEPPDAPEWMFIEQAKYGGSSGEGGGNAGHWEPVHLDGLHPADRAALDALRRLGGHSEYKTSYKDTYYIAVTRPDKTAGTSASVGYVAPGVVKIFTSDWTVTGDIRFPEEAVYDADRLAAIADAIEAKDETLVNKLVTSDLRELIPTNSKTSDDTEPESRRHFKTGATFVLDDPAELSPIWGAGDQVLWASGEPCLIVGPTGVGKTTFAMQIIAGRLGIDDSFLGQQITPTEDTTLYLAMDRPRQIRRAMRRLFNETHRALLNERLVVWEGPLPLDLGKTPITLLELVEHVHAKTVIIDSLKDAAVKLSDDEVGGNLNRALQHCVTAGIEVLGLHHQRKGQGGTKPTTLEDVYGSTWITAGAGSVILLWGAAGDLLIELTHLKQPAAEVGPLKIEHNHDQGRSTVYRGQVDPLIFLTNAGSNGVTTTQLAQVMFEKPKVSENERKKAQRQLDRLVDSNQAQRTEAVAGGIGGSIPARYYLTILPGPI